MSINFSYSQVSKSLTEYEQNCVKVFSKLKSDLSLKLAQSEINNKKASVSGKEQLSGQLSDDSNFFKKIIDEYFLVLDENTDDSTLRTNFPPKQFYDFYSFFVGRNIDKISIRPLRLCKDTYVYSRLSTFQKQNAFGLIDNSTDPEKVFTYLLFNGA